MEDKLQGDIQTNGGGVKEEKLKKENQRVVRQNETWMPLWPDFPECSLIDGG